MLSYSNVIATIALFAALGGSSYAAVAHISQNSVSTKHVRDRSLLARDFKRGQLKRGPVGPVGPAGQRGAAGPAGASGVLGVLGFQAQWSPANLPGNNGNTSIKPVGCRTAAYTAGADEEALIAVSATASPTAQVTDVLYVNAMVAENGGQLDTKNKFDAAESLQDGTAHATVNIRYPLEAGTSYVFGAGFASNSAVSISPGYCMGTVMIVRT